MKAQFEHISSKKGTESFLAYALTVPYFEFKWHYHPEFELTLITHGNGKRLVGDSYDNYEAGDLVLLGRELPHTWTSEPIKNKKVSAIVVQFPADFIERFTGLEEFKRMKAMLAAADRGLFFHDAHAVCDDLEKLPALSGVERVMALLAILNQLAVLRYKKVSSEYFQLVKGEKTESRINKVCQYIQKHADEPLSLEQVAGLIHLSRSAFSKFFKRATGKTFSDYVNDIRISRACHLLAETDKPINEIAHATGFESLSYFNRVFLKKKGVTPSQFSSGFV